MARSIDLSMNSSRCHGADPSASRILAAGLLPLLQPRCSCQGSASLHPRGQELYLSQYYFRCRQLAAYSSPEKVTLVAATHLSQKLEEFDFIGTNKANDRPCPYGVSQ